MRAAVLKGPEKIEIEEKPLPELHEDEVLIEMKYCGICGSDLEILAPLMEVGASCRARLILREK